MNEEDHILVSAPNSAGMDFIKQLIFQEIPVAALVNNRLEYERMTEIGVNRIIMINTIDKDSWLPPDNLLVGKIYLFENSLNLCYRYIQMCRSWTTKPLYVITCSSKSRLHYKGMGVNKVIHITKNDISTILTDCY